MVVEKRHLLEISRCRPVVSISISHIQRKKITVVAPEPTAHDRRAGTNRETYLYVAGLWAAPFLLRRAASKGAVRRISRVGDAPLPATSAVRDLGVWAQENLLKLVRIQVNHHATVGGIAALGNAGVGNSPQRTEADGTRVGHMRPRLLHLNYDVVRPRRERGYPLGNAATQIEVLYVPWVGALKYYAVGVIPTIPRRAGRVRACGPFVCSCLPPASKNLLIVDHFSIEQIF